MPSPPATNPTAATSRSGLPAPSTPNTAITYMRMTAVWRVWGWDGLVHRRVSMPDSLAGVPPDATSAPTPDHRSTTAIAGVALAAGAGLRLRPLTLLLPKPLCPVANEPLVDHA